MGADDGDIKQVLEVSIREHTMSHYRTGENKPAKTGRADRVRVGTHVQRAIVANRNSGRLLAADYLAGIGADREFASRYGSAFGRAVAKTYREQTGTEPAAAGAAIVRGRIRPVMAYRTEDADILALAARTYPRTAAMAAAPTAQTAPVEAAPEPAADAVSAEETNAWAHFTTGAGSRTRQNLTILRLTDAQAEQLAEDVWAPTTEIRENGRPVLVHFEAPGTDGGTRHWVRIIARSPLAEQTIKQQLGRNLTTARSLADRGAAPHALVA
jgi:hypothetical protein